MNKSLQFYLEHSFSYIMAIALALAAYLIVAIVTMALIENKIIADVVSTILCLGLAYLITIRHMNSKMLKFFTAITIIILFSLNVNKIFYLKTYDYMIRGMSLNAEIPKDSSEHDQINELFKSNNIKDYMKNIGSFQKASKIQFFDLKREIELSNIENKDKYKEALYLLTKESFMSASELSYINNKFCEEVVNEFAKNNKDILNENLNLDKTSKKLTDCEVVKLINSTDAKNFKGLNIKDMNYFNVNDIYENYLK